MMSKKIKNHIVENSETAIKAFSYHNLTIFTVVAHVLTFLLSTQGSLFPGEEGIQSIAGTCAEIVAGLYGLTLASYTFFLSRIDALAASDMTLDYVVTSIKNRFKYLIWFITFNVLMSLIISIFLMYCPAPSETEQEFYYRLFCNEFILFISFSIALILWYSIRVIAPGCLAQEAKKLKQKISKASEPAGSVVEFICLYDQIVNACNAMVPEVVLQQIHDNKGKHFEYTIALLDEVKPELKPLISKLIRIHRYYECVVNCTTMSVTQEMCLLEKEVLAALDQTQSQLPAGQ